jgi:ABC-2 type transport system permease protein
MGFLSMPTTIFAIGAWILIVFYSLDALYTERKNKSILFWRSLPLTETETVLSKLITAMFVIPIVSFAIAAMTHIVLLILASFWVMSVGADAGHLIWSSVPLFDVWLGTFIVAIAMMFWLSPFVGWFLFVSAFARRSPFLIATMGIILLPIVERIVSPTSFFRDAIWERTFTPPLADLDFVKFMDDDLHVEMTPDLVSIVSAIDIQGFVSSPSLWAGIVVCGLFTTAAIYVRRFRDDS